MNATNYAELFLNTYGERGEKELRTYVASGGDINEPDADGTTAGEIAALEMQSKNKKTAAAANRLSAIVAELGGTVE